MSDAPQPLYKEGYMRLLKECSDMTEKIKELEADRATMQARIDELMSAIKGLNVIIDAHGNVIDAKKQRITELEAQLAAKAKIASDLDAKLSMSKQMETWANIDALRADNKRLEQALAAAQRDEWQVVSHVSNGLDNLHADEMAITIAYEGIGLATFEWPEEVGYEYAVVRRIAKKGGADVE